MEPDLVATPKYAALTAGWFWSTHGCNEAAESGAPLSNLGLPTWGVLTKKINGGTICLPERIAHTNQAMACLACRVA